MLRSKQHLKYSPAAAVVLALVSAPKLAQAADYYVDRAAAPHGDGSPEAPFTLLSEAYAAVAAGEDAKIHVAAGQYSDNIGDGEDGYGQNTRYTFLGGYAPGFGSRDPIANVTTVVAAYNQQPVFWFFNASSVTIDGFSISQGKSGILVEGWADGRQATVRNCRVTENGHFTGNNYDDGSLQNGGGIQLTGYQVVLSESFVERNHSANFGGGVYIASTGEVGATALVERTVVRDNIAHGGQAHGGGIWFSTSGIVRGNAIIGNSIDNPSGGGAGGGLIVIGNGTDALVERNLVKENSCITGGGGIFVDDEARATIANNVVVHNHAGGTGSGIDVDGLSESQPSYATLINNTVAFNGGDTGRTGQGLYVRGGSQVTSTNDLFWNNGEDDVFARAEEGANITLEHSSFLATTLDGLDQLSGNLSSDPLFVGADDYRVTEGSPMVNAGGVPPSSVGADFRCIARSQGGSADIGAFELAVTSSTPESDCQLPVDAPPAEDPVGGGGEGLGGSSGGDDGDGDGDGDGSDDAASDGGSDDDHGGLTGVVGCSASSGSPALPGEGPGGALLLLGLAGAVVLARRRTTTK